MAVGIAAGEGKIDLDEKITDLFAAEIENGKIQGCIFPFERRKNTRKFNSEKITTSQVAIPP